MKRAEFRVYGLVQGVGFRYFVYRIANSLNLKGFAKNMYDGTVYVVAEGDDDKIAELHKQLRIGPSHAYVEKVEVEYSEPKNEFTKFEIR
ncbi:MAG: Acylphosphate phosphohydrolase [Candidatus Kapaibacterium sp.]|nr:MAG: Acylphosphate phosphohydrolase [Candidatus Kapabacteria bacterium]